MLKFGWKKDPADTSDRHSMTLIAGTEPALDRPSHLEFRGRRLFQDYAGACVSFAKTRAFQLMAAMQGKGEDKLISPMLDYYNGRTYEHAGMDPWKTPPIEDNGQFPRVSMQATAHFGVVDWDSYVYDWTKVNEAPPEVLYAKAYKCRGVQWFRVFEAMGDEDISKMVIREVADCMMRRSSVIFGMRVDRAFVSNGGSVVDEIDSSQVLGGHMMTVLEVREDTILCDNWWKGVGNEDGTIEISHRCFTSWAVGDIIAIKGIPEGW